MLIPATMLKCTLRFIIFSCVFLLCKSFPGQMLGPGIIIFQSFENCDPPVNELNLWLTQRKFNRTTNVIDVTLSTPWPFGDNVIMEVNTAIKKDGGYKPGSFHMKGPFCKTMQTVSGDLFDEILAAAGVDDCPIPGAVKIDGFYINSDQLNQQVLYGEHRAELLFYVDEEIVGCYMMYLNLIPTED